MGSKPLHFRHFFHESAAVGRVLGFPHTAALHRLEATAGIEPAYTALQDLAETIYFAQLLKKRQIIQLVRKIEQLKRVTKKLNQSK